MITLAEGELTRLLGLEKGDEIPKGETFVAKNGVFTSSSSPIFDIVKPEYNVFKGFKEVEPSAKMSKKIPWRTFWLGPAWLKKQWDNRKKIEYMILLFYHPEKEEFCWIPPVQEGSSASVDYGVADDETVRDMVKDGWTLAGTMHNHFGNRGSAFQSGTDSHDEQRSGAAGVHFTMGYMDSPNLYNCEFHVRIVDGAFDREVKLKDCVEHEIFEFPEDWDDKLKIKLPNQVKKFVSDDGTFTYESWKKEYDKKNKIKSNRFGSKTSSGWTPLKGGQVPLLSKFPGIKRLQDFVSDDSDDDEQEDASIINACVEENGASEEFEILCDAPIVFETPDENPEYDAAIRKFPAIFNLAGGEDILKAMTLAKVIYDGAQYANMDSEEVEENREVLLSKTVEEMGMTAEYIVQALTDFSNKQLKALKK